MERVPRVRALAALSPAERRLAAFLTRTGDPGFTVGSADLPLTVL